MLLPARSGGSALALGGDGNPNSDRRFGFDYQAAATAASEGGVRYWNLPGTLITYCSGGSGHSARLHLYASGGQQHFNWQTQRGFLSNPGDVNNQEFTAYVRVHEILQPGKAQVTLKIRGGRHSDRDPQAASCTMMTFGPGGRGRRAVSRFGKELTHPEYEHVKLTPLHGAKLTDNTWFGLKLLSYQRSPAAVVYQLFVDRSPFDPAGRPANQWQLLSEYLDEEGKAIGCYDTLVNWGGWETTLRMDGYRSIDFAFPSVREVVPPASE